MWIVVQVCSFGLILSQFHKWSHFHKWNHFAHFSPFCLFEKLLSLNKNMLAISCYLYIQRERVTWKTEQWNILNINTISTKVYNLGLLTVFNLQINEKHSLLLKIYIHKKTKIQEKYIVIWIFFIFLKLFENSNFTRPLPK